MPPTENLSVASPGPSVYRPTLLSVVVIGLNEAARLHASLTAVLQDKPDGWDIEVVYVDSGSTDDSVRIAQGVPGVRVLRLDDPRPSAAKARNLGLRSTSGQFVQLIDGDSIVQPGWTAHALQRLWLQPDLACVFGHCIEMFPRQSVYMRVCSFDWHIPAGDRRLCGGNAMWRRSVLASHRYFDDSLRLGEEPDLCYRVRASGWRIVCIDRPMVLHDLGMTTFRQYWRRGVGTGQAYMQVSARYWRRPEKLWLRECVRNAAEPLLWLAIGLAAWLGSGMAAAACVLLALWTIRAIQIGRTVRARAASWVDALLYGAHCQFVRIPVLLGQFQGLVRRW